MTTIATEINRIAEKRLQGGRICLAEALFLYQEADLFTLGELANQLNQAINGTTVFYNINHHINPTNICVNQCRFCAYSKLEGEDGAYEQSIDDILEEVKSAEAQGITEFHIVGGLHPHRPFSYYLELLRSLRKAHPGIILKAFTAVEIEYFSRIAKLPVREILIQLKEAGLQAMPGGGAEIFAPAVRNRICPEKISGDAWLDIMAVAHELEIPTNATMLYGHIETIADRLDHMEQLRQLQDRTGGFQVFIPLAFHATNTEIRKLGETSGIDDLKTLAMARIFLDNFRHLKAYWIMLGEKIAQVGLHFGVNDLDGTVVKERITHAAGAKSAKGHDEFYIRNLISRAGRQPQERDTFYQPLLHPRQQTGKS